jgi:hypothetical protein
MHCWKQAMTGIRWKQEGWSGQARPKTSPENEVANPVKLRQTLIVIDTEVRNPCEAVINTNNTNEIIIKY